MNPLTFISIRVEGSFCSFMAMMVCFSHEMREEAKSRYSSIFNCRSYKYKLSNIPYFNLTAKESFWINYQYINDTLIIINQYENIISVALVYRMFLFKYKLKCELLTSYSMGLQLGKKPLCWETLNVEYLAFGLLWNALAKE